MPYQTSSQKVFKKLALKTLLNCQPTADRYSPDMSFNGFLFNGLGLKPKESISVFLM